MYEAIVRSIPDVRSSTAQMPPTDVVAQPTRHPLRATADRCATVSPVDPRWNGWRE